MTGSSFTEELQEWDAGTETPTSETALDLSTISEETELGRSEADELVETASQTPTVDIGTAAVAKSRRRRIVVEKSDHILRVRKQK